MTFELYMDFMWKEARKVCCSSRDAETYSEIFPGLQSTTTPLAGALLDTLWLQLTSWRRCGSQTFRCLLLVLVAEGYWTVLCQIYMCKQFLKRQIVTEVAGLIIYRNKEVLYTVSTEVIIACPMKFAAYPVRYWRTIYETIYLYRK